MTRTHSNPLSFDFDFIWEIKAQERTRDGMFELLKALTKGRNIGEACDKAEVTRETYYNWNKSYPTFKAKADELVAANQAAFEAGVKARRTVRLEGKGLVFDPERELPDKGEFAQFCWDMFGRPDQAHYKEFNRAVQTPAISVIIFLGPAGCGKDTKAGDAVAWLKADNRGENRVAWIMTTEGAAVKRLGRLGRYFTDPRLYDVLPAETPGGQKPVRNLVTEYGPFRWHKDMVFPNGDKVPRSVWTKNEMFFCGAETNESDPDIAASGIDSEIYGNRIRTLVTSDMFTLDNQKNPTLRAEQMEKIRTTQRTRGDGRMKEIHLGTMLPIENNWETLIEERVGTSGVLQSDENSTLYRNGVMLIRHPAILDQGSERERSFWEERFPFRTTYYLHDGDNVLSQALHELSNTEALEWMDKGATKVDGLLESRGEPGSKQWNSFQATHQQIRVESADLTDFTDKLLDLCDDPNRSYGITRPGEVTTIGADPARKNGAAYVTWAVDTVENTITMVDEFWDTMLGTDGIKKELIMFPIQAWQPLWYGYEINKFEAELDDWTIREFLESQPTNLYRHRTDWINRPHDSLGPAQMVGLMQRRIIRFPAATPKDQERSARVKQQFKNWDRQATNAAGRQRSGSSYPDDLCMAAWVGIIKARELLERGKVGRTLPTMPVPASVKRRWDEHQRKHNVATRMKSAERERVTAAGLIAQFISQPDEEP